MGTFPAQGAKKVRIAYRSLNPPSQGDAARLVNLPVVESIVLITETPLVRQGES